MYISIAFIFIQVLNITKLYLFNKVYVMGLNFYQMGSHFSQDNSLCNFPVFFLLLFLFSCSVMSYSCDLIHSSPPGSSVHGISHNTEVVSHFLLQGSFLTQGLKPCLMLGRWILYAKAPGKCSFYVKHQFPIFIWVFFQTYLYIFIPDLLLLNSCYSALYFTHFKVSI